jgi:aromatic ring-opening dioxygenase catalytic subunit (LigB family)
LRYAQEFADWLHDRLTARDTESLIAYRERGPEARARASDRGALPAAARRLGRPARTRAERVFTGFDGGALANDTYVFHPETTASAMRHRKLIEARCLEHRGDSPAR